MTSSSALNEMTPEDRASYGFARARSAAFQAVQTLWRRRKAEGMTQLQLAERIAMDPARLSKHLRGPGNWTLRTFGELVEALNGEAQILVHGIEDRPIVSTNYDAYAEMMEFMVPPVLSGPLVRPQAITKVDAVPPASKIRTVSLAG